MHRVLQQVDQHLFQLDMARTHRGGGGPGRRHGQRDRLVADLVAQQQQRAVDHFRHADIARFFSRAPTEMELFLGNLADAGGKPGDLSEIARSLVRVRGSEQALSRLGIDAHCRERLANFVTQPGGDLAEGREAVGLLELLAQGGRLRRDLGGGAGLSLTTPHPCTCPRKPQQRERAHPGKACVGKRNR